MPRKAFIADLNALKSRSVGSISNVRAGDDDGEFIFNYDFKIDGSSVRISGLIPDLGEYPKNHDCYIFASEDCPTLIAACLDDKPDLTGKPVLDILSVLDKHLSKKTASGGKGDPLIVDDDGDVDMPDSQFNAGNDSDDEQDADIDNEDWVLEESGPGVVENGWDSVSPTTAALATRARRDMRALKEAGFKLGFEGKLGGGNVCYLSAACRVAKLGISEEAMEAWTLSPSEYLVLLLYYPAGYLPWDELNRLDSVSARARVSFRVGIAKTYKPTLDEIHRVFKPGVDEINPSQDTQTYNGAFRPCFISKPLNDLLDERLVQIVKYRLSMQMSWLQAESYYNENQGMDRRASNSMGSANESFYEDESTVLPPLVTQDDLLGTDQKDVSFPLAAMRFMLRHFVRCTEFCLVCHSKLDTQVEAIKPYVCSNPLCLYQYMSLGFGPSIEHEIITQPYVMDLLISFCYSAAKLTSLQSYPEGLALSVPDITLPIKGWQIPVPSYNYNGNYSVVADTNKQTADNGTNLSQQLMGKFYPTTQQLLIENDTSRNNILRKGEWIVVNPISGNDYSWHCRVVDTSLFPTIQLSYPIVLAGKNAEDGDGAHKMLATGDDPVLVEFHRYSLNLDDLDQTKKCYAIVLLLDLLPSVKEMRQFLLRKQGSQLKDWVDSICAAGLGLLRWIIASNRSCIMQVDNLEVEGETLRATRGEDRIQGISGWLQFRFAMGAPDKEQRFVNSIRQEKGNAAYPTMFAWHGSPLANWHSIIRQGLHFNKVSHGRAFGDGCYHAKDFNTSGGYSNRHNAVQAWPQSELQVGGAIALSEIVNAPEKFKSSNPYYVVAQLDWIQTRYLFVSSGRKLDLDEVSKGEKVEKVPLLLQDPQRTPHGPNNKMVEIPVTALPKSRRQRGQPGSVPIAPPVVQQSSKRQKLAAGARSIFSKGQSQQNAINLDDYDDDDDNESVATLVEDLEILFEPERPATPPPAPKSKTISKSTKPAVAKGPTEPVTSFVASPIDDLPVMPPPPYATPQASKRLQRDFRRLLATQETHLENGTLHELGWYMDPEWLSRNENLYQWIVELHSFPKKLPLATDLAQAGMQSVVMEIRFHANYPITPPFVRVIRPRFLMFSAGGGGHVTAGGSICMDLLTNSGWTAVIELEFVLMQIRMAIMSTDPRPARLENSRSSHRGGMKDYGVGESVDAYRRVAGLHGWRVPEELNEIHVERSGSALLGGKGSSL